MSVYSEAPYEEGQRYRFFPPLATFDPPYPIAPDCYLPNSVVLSKLRKSQADQELAKSWKPPSLSDKQRQLMEQVHVYTCTCTLYNYMYMYMHVTYLYS